MKKARKAVRHGDVDLIPTTKPKKATRLFSGQKYTVAYGEVTGHHHDVITKGKKATQIWKYGGKTFLILKEAGVITHQEHNKTVIPKGTYEVKIETEHNPFKNVRERVID